MSSIKLKQKKIIDTIQRSLGVRFKGNFTKDFDFLDSYLPLTPVRENTWGFTKEVSKNIQFPFSGSTIAIPVKKFHAGVRHNPVSRKYEIQAWYDVDYVLEGRKINRVYVFSCVKRGVPGPAPVSAIYFVPKQQLEQEPTALYSIEYSSPAFADTARLSKLYAQNAPVIKTLDAWSDCNDFFNKCCSCCCPCYNDFSAEFTASGSADCQDATGSYPVPFNSKLGECCFWYGSRLGTSRVWDCLFGFTFQMSWAFQIMYHIPTSQWSALVFTDVTCGYQFGDNDATECAGGFCFQRVIMDCATGGTFDLNAIDSTCPCGDFCCDGTATVSPV